MSPLRSSSELTGTLFHNANTTSSTIHNNVHNDDIDTAVSILPLILMALLLGAVTVLGIGLLSWFLKRCCCSCFQHAEASTTTRNHRRNYYYNQEEEEDQDSIVDLEEGTVPSEISIPSPTTISPKGRSERRRRRRPLPASLFLVSLDDASTVLTSEEDDNSKSFSSSSSSSASSEKDSPEKHNDNESSFPNATIQFRNPINPVRYRRQQQEEDHEIDRLLDFLSHMDAYVEYPRSRLTILLRARAPRTPEQAADLEDLTHELNDAAAASSTKVFLCHDATQDLLLRCAPKGELLVTFASVQEIPKNHKEFLRDLVE